MNDSKNRNNTNGLILSCDSTNEDEFSKVYESQFSYQARYREAKKKVKCSALEEPCQRITNRGFKTKVDCYITRLIKFPNENAVAHSVYEYLLWGILEGDDTVRYMVPQSHLFYIGNRRYTPDLYFEREGRRYIVEVKSEEGFKEFEEKSYYITEYLRPTNFKFIHITNESIAERETFARNWLRIVQTLVTSNYINTERACELIVDRLHEKSLEVGDIVDMVHRVEESQLEVALYRLAHNGKVKLDLENERLNAATKVELCQ